ncbi:MAG: tRNA uridine-5-carboxymethylaminomethyl(34) synthesis GTPase MnmE [Candidatus Hydrogenedentota bacterium]
MHASEDTIAAIATPPGEGGVGIVRLSGPGALGIGAGLFRSSTGKNPLQGRQRVYHGHAVDAQGAVIDEVLLHLMPAPHSYTREDVAEINAHGGAGPLNAIVDAALALGARLAQPGEFTQRAFMNGRIDLVQAEAVIDTIRARTKAGLRAAQAAAAGKLSQEIHALSDKLAHALACMEAAVDFPEEDLPDLVTPELIDNLRTTHTDMQRLLDTAEAGRLLREGVTVAMAGRVNVGKSSLFNALLRDNRAIVTEVAGTTRDRLEETITLGGVPVRLIDTAGLRVTNDAVEAIGVARAREALAQAQCVLLVLDAACEPTAEEEALARELVALGTPLVRVLNKIDLAPEAAPPALPANFVHTARISAVTGEGMEAFEAALAQLLLGEAHIAADQAMLTRAHQRDSLRRATENLGHMLDNLGQSPEFLAFDLREALDALGEITGETTPDDLLGRIFSQFCIGK